MSDGTSDYYYEVIIIIWRAKYKNTLNFWMVYCFPVWNCLQETDQNFYTAVTMPGTTSV